MEQGLDQVWFDGCQSVTLAESYLLPHIYNNIHTKFSSDIVLYANLTETSTNYHRHEKCATIAEYYFCSCQS